MRYAILITVLFINSMTGNAQRILSENGRAKRIFQQGEKLRSSRKFREAIDKYNLAIRKDSGFAEAYYQAAASYSILLEPDSAFVYYKELSERYPDTLYYIGAHLRMAEYYFSKGEYENALMHSSKYLSVKEKPDRYSRMAENIRGNSEFALNRIANPLAFNPRPLPYPLNEFKQQYFPVLSADQQELFFIKRDQSEEIYTSKRDTKGKWQAPTPIDSSLTSKYNEGTCSVSADGRTMVFTSCMRNDSYGSCDLYITYKIGGQWTEPVNMGAPVNSARWDSQPALSADGRTMYFVSTRKGGLGKRDIWVTYQKTNGKWSIPKNLGEQINTEEDDISPFIHVNNQTLYFATNARPGFGGFDIYLSEKRDDGGWGEPENFGYPINTMHDELAMFITADGESGYYSYETKENGQLISKLYQIDIPDEISLKYRSSFIKGVIYDEETREPLHAKIQLFNMLKHELVGEVRSDSIAGDYLMVLTEGAEYALYMDAPGYLFKSYHFDFHRDSISLEGLTANIGLKKLQIGGRTTLNNVLFDFDSYELSEKSKVALMYITGYLKDHPEFLIEIAGHTDNRGSDEYNMNLSLNRAKTVYNYLITNGIEAERLFFAGYGSKEPIASNITPEGQALNRRIELRILE